MFYWKNKRDQRERERESPGCVLGPVNERNFQVGFDSASRSRSRHWFIWRKKRGREKKVTSVGLEYQTTLDFFDQFDPSQKAWFTGFISVLGYNIYQKVVEHVQLLRCQTRIYSSEYNRTPAVEIIPDQMNWEWLMKWFNIWG